MWPINVHPTDNNCFLTTNIVLFSPCWFPSESIICRVYALIPYLSVASSKWIWIFSYSMDSTEKYCGFHNMGKSVRLYKRKRIFLKKMFVSNYKISCNFLNTLWKYTLHHLILPILNFEITPPPPVNYILLAPWPFRAISWLVLPQHLYLMCTEESIITSPGSLIFPTSLCSCPWLGRVATFFFFFFATSWPFFVSFFF